MRAAGVRPQGRTHAQSGASNERGASGRHALAVHARALALAAAHLSLDELAEFIDELPRAQHLLLHATSKLRLYRERAAIVPVPPPVVVTAPRDDDEILTADEAAGVLKTSLDTLYARVRRGELEPLPRCRGGRLKFRRGDLRRPVAGAVNQRYSSEHDTRRGQTATPPARLDATAARRRVERDRDDRRPLGARGAGRDAPRRNEPYAPSQAAWRGDRRPPESDGA